MDERLALLSDLRELRARILATERRFQAVLSNVHLRNRASARNLIHYLALRASDLRPLQDRLARQGLSSLGRAEAHVLPTIDAVIGTLAAGVGEPRPELREAELDFSQGERLLEENTDLLLGAEPPPPTCAHHGHHAAGSSGRSGAGSRAAAGGDGLHAHQLRAR
jgi:pyruvate kinase